MAKEGLMKWGRLAVNWRQLKNKIGFRRLRLSDGDSQLFELVGAEISRVGKSDDSQPVAFHSDDRGKQGEFSLHIGG
jgi:hypothetical protein